LSGFGIFWSVFILVLSFTQLSNSCTLTTGVSGAVSPCDTSGGVKALCNPSSSSDAAVFAISAQGAAGNAGDLFCGWPIGLSANRLFAGFLNLIFSILHLINMVNGRFILAKTSAYSAAFMYDVAPVTFFLIYFSRHIVYLLFGAWWFANMCSDSNVSRRFSRAEQH
jgi:hypothetical protein